MHFFRVYIKYIHILRDLLQDSTTHFFKNSYQTILNISDNYYQIILFSAFISSKQFWHFQSYYQIILHTFLQRSYQVILVLFESSHQIILHTFFQSSCQWKLTFQRDTTKQYSLCQKYTKQFWHFQRVTTK